MKKILLVEDDRALSSILEIGLQFEGYAVETAFDGIEALKKALQYKPDLIILDINLPKLSGFDVAKHFRERDELKKIPIIVLTGLCQITNRKRAYSLGVENYLIKPFDIEQLFIKIKEYLS